MFDAKETCITVSITPQLVDTSQRATRRLMTPLLIRRRMTILRTPRKTNIAAESDEVDKALLAGGSRVQNNVMALLSDRLQKQLSLKTVDERAAPYRARVDVKITQSQDGQGDDLYEIGLDINFQEATATKTGLTGFMDVYHFYGQTFAASKVGIEPQVYVALDQAAEKMRQVFAQASEYCTTAPCK